MAKTDAALIDQAFQRSGHGPRCWRALLAKAGGPAEDFLQAVEARAKEGQEMNSVAVAKILRENFQVKTNSHSVRRHYSRACSCEGE